VAHEFECKALRSLRAAANSFEERGHEMNRPILAEVLEQILSKQLSMVPGPEMLVDKTSLGDALQQAISGNRAVKLAKTVTASPDRTSPIVTSPVQEEQRLKPASPTPSGVEPRPGLQRQNTEAAGKSRFHRKRTTLTGANVGKPEILPATFLPATSPALGRSLMPMLSAGTMLLVQDDHSMWKVSLKSKTDAVTSSVQDPKSVQANLRMFDVCLSHAHNAAGAARLVSRWAGATNYLPAVKEVMEKGLFYSMLSGICHTRLFSREPLRPEAVVAVVCHKMALHIAASQDWRNVAPILQPSADLQEHGLTGLECAEYSAYYAFLKPLRLPFVQLQPIMPIICIARGSRVREALLAMPFLLEPIEEDETPTGKPRISSRVGTFLEVATEHLSKIQLVDSVTLDVQTGRTYFLLYKSVMEEKLGKENEAWVLLLDAARGMQVVASPIPARDLRRCAL